MNTDQILQLATPIAMIALMVMQKREATKIAGKLVTATQDTAKEVKSELAVSTTHRDGKLDEIHDLVNSEMTKALRKIDAQRRQIIKGLTEISGLRAEVKRLTALMNPRKKR